MAKTKHEAAKTALKHFLNSESFSRITLPRDVGVENASLHSIVSTIRNTYFVPISSEYNAQGVCEYWMEQEEINRFYNDRQTQREEMKDEVYLNGIIRESKALLRLAEKLAVNSEGIYLMVNELDGKGRFAELIIKAANDCFGQGASLQGGVA